MKKTLLTLFVIAFTTCVSAQSVRLSLYENFTSETCPPDATINPGLQVKLDSNVSKIIAIKWHTPIPSAPTASWSPYQANKIENDWRWKPTTGPGYGYPSQNTASVAITNGINSSPQGRIDGQHQWTFGAASDHPANLNTGVINTAQAVTSPFDIVMTRTWDPTFTAVLVTVSITATQNFIATGALVYRLVMVEQELHFTTAPGTNGEKNFYNTARASFPNIQNGTSLPGTWTVGQNQTFTLNCNLPVSIVDKSQVNFVGFIQDDGNKKVMQASATTTVGLSDDIAVSSVNGIFISCGSKYSTKVIFRNNGINPITSFDLDPAIDGVFGTTMNWSGNLAVGASDTIIIPPVTVLSGTHIYSANLSNINGNYDNNSSNNTKGIPFNMINSYYSPPLFEDFTLAAFPPANWTLINVDLSSATWSRVNNVGGFGTGLGSAKYDFYDNSNIGDSDDLVLTPLNFSGVSNMILSFDVAYAQYSAENDKLEVKASTDCGTTWNTLYAKAGATLATAPPVTPAFVPTSTQWRKDLINLSAFNNLPEVLIKFTATTAYGNNMYIDNINLSGPTAIKSEKNVFSRLDIYPNPAGNFTNVDFELQKNETVNILVINSTGQIIYKSETENLESGIHNIKLNTETWSSGIYSVNIKTTEGTASKKLIIDK